MTNQEAADLIRIAQAEIEWDYPMEYAIAFDKAIEALEAAGWVSVKDRLPEKEDSYIVMTEKRFEHVPYKVMQMEFEIATINRQEKRRWKWNGKLPIWPVTHWMPMPTPPET